MVSQALFNNTTGCDNTALGTNAGHGPYHGAITSSVSATNVHRCGDDEQLRTWIEQRLWRHIRRSGATARSSVVSADGQLGTVTSSERFKKDIATMDKASEAILRAQAGHVPLQDGHHGHTAIWFDCGGSRKGESGAWCCPIRKENRTPCATKR